MKPSRPSHPENPRAGLDTPCAAYASYATGTGTGLPGHVTTHITPMHAYNA